MPRLLLFIPSSCTSATSVRQHVRHPSSSTLRFERGNSHSFTHPPLLPSQFGSVVARTCVMTCMPCRVAPPVFHCVWRSVLGPVSTSHLSPPASFLLVWRSILNLSPSSPSTPLVAPPVACRSVGATVRQQRQGRGSGDLPYMLSLSGHVICLRMSATSGALRFSRQKRDASPRIDLKLQTSFDPASRVLRGCSGLGPLMLRGQCERPPSASVLRCRSRSRGVSRGVGAPLQLLVAPP